jgi:hypothetical protein
MQGAGRQATNLAFGQRNPISMQGYQAGKFGPIQQTQWFNPANRQYGSNSDGSLTGRQGGQFDVNRQGYRLNANGSVNPNWQADPLGQVWQNNLLGGFVDQAGRVRNGVLPWESNLGQSQTDRRYMGQGGMQFQTNDWGMKVDPRTGSVDVNSYIDPNGGLWRNGIYSGTTDAMGRVIPLLMGGAGTAAPVGATGAGSAGATGTARDYFGSATPSDAGARAGLGGASAGDPRGTSALGQNQPASGLGYLQQLNQFGREAGDTVGNSFMINPAGTVAPQSMQENAALNQMEQRALAGSPIMDAAKQNMLDTLSGKYLDPGTNPAWDPMSRRITDAYRTGTAAQTDAAFAQSNSMGLGNSAYEQALQRNQTSLGDSLGLLAGNLYSPERDRQIRVGAAAPAMAQADYIDPQMLQSVGQQRRGENQKLIDAMTGATYGQQDYPWEQLQRYGGVLPSFMGMGSVQTGPNPARGSAAANAIGTGLSSYGALAAANVANPAAWAALAALAAYSASS